MQGLENTTLTAEKEYALNFREEQEKLYLSLHYNGAHSYLFVNVVEIYKVKAKSFEINSGPVWLVNVSKKKKKKSAGNLQKTGLYGYINDFSVVYYILMLLIIQILINV